MAMHNKPNRRKFIKHIGLGGITATLTPGALLAGEKESVGNNQIEDLKTNAGKHVYNQEYTGAHLNRIAFPIGGMGAGDVKLLAGVGAWIWGTATFQAFCVSVIAGAIIAVAMVLWNRAWTKHRDQFMVILTEIITIRDPDQLSAIAAERKPSMLLLPYGIPIAVGTIAYFAWMGMLL